VTAVVRRVLVGVALGLLLAPLAAVAQPGGRTYRIAYLGNSSPTLEADLVGAFRVGLHELGYVEGQNIVIDFRWAEGRYDRFPAFAAEAVRLNADVIVTAGTPGALAAKRATSTIPIVLAVIADPVSVGIVPSLARPGGNITGSATMLHELAGKRLDLLRALVPGVSRAAVIWNPSNPANASLIRELQAAAARSRLAIEPMVDGGGERELAKGFAAIVAARPEALVVEPDRALLAHRATIVAFAARQKLPTVYPYREYVEAGGLVSYAPNFPAMFRRAASFVDRILKGARPGDLPVEQPTTFELTVNVKTAKALGVTVPPSVLLQADRVIE
jgi:putative ABC transport system substrate-binding protein